MSEFLAVTAFRSDSVPDVCAAIGEYLTLYGVTTEPVPLTAPPDPALHVTVFNPVNGWTLALWPMYFNIHDFPLVRATAASRNWLVSTVHVYDGEYWEHLCCKGADVIHEFCSRPNFWKDESSADYTRMQSYSSDPAKMAEVLKIDSKVLQQYLIDIDNTSGNAGKAFNDDEFDLENIWVFTDFWRQCGIEYPDPSKNRAAVLRLRRNFASKLPIG